MQLGDAAAAVLYNNTSYLTTSAIASPTVSQEMGKDTNLLALFAAIRRDSPFAAVNFLCALRVTALVAVAPVFSLEAELRSFRTAQQPSSP